MPHTKARAILRSWAIKRGVTTPELAEQTGFSYQHAWNLLHSERQSVTLTTLGQLLVTYGADGPAVAMAEAMKAALAKNGSHK